MGYFSAADGIVGDNVIHVVRELVTASAATRTRRTFTPARRRASEPMYKNLLAKSNLSGDFVVLNPWCASWRRG